MREACRAKWVPLYFLRGPRDKTCNLYIARNLPGRYLFFFFSFFFFFFFSGPLRFDHESLHPFFSNAPATATKRRKKSQNRMVKRVGPLVVRSSGHSQILRSPRNRPWSFLSPFVLKALQSLCFTLAERMYESISSRSSSERTQCCTQRWVARWAPDSPITITVASYTTTVNCQPILAGLLSSIRQTSHPYSSSAQMDPDVPKDSYRKKKTK